MKKIIFSMFFAIMLMASCTPKDEQSKVANVDSLTIVKPELYFHVLDTVEGGNTVWGFSENHYGTGLHWKDVINQNDFLNEPGRTWYSKKTNKWYCLLYPGEVIKMEPQYVSVSDTVSSAQPLLLKKESNLSSGDKFLYFLLVILGCLALYGLYQGLKLTREHKARIKQMVQLRKDPVKEGTPFCEKGVNATQIHQRIGEIVSAEFPGATYKIKRIFRGKMNGPAKVFYKGEQQPKDFIFSNQSGYEASVEINNEEKDVYCLQGCGNPIKEGDYFIADSGFEFIRDVIVNEDGLEVPYCEEEEEQVLSNGSEFHQHVEKTLVLLDGCLKENDQRHKVIIDLGYDHLNVTIENRFPERKNGEQKIEKKESRSGAN